MVDENISNRVKKLIAYINGNLVEKQEAVKLSVLAAIAGESIFFLGPPGTAKSLIARRLRNLFKESEGATPYFEYLMNQFSTPEEVFGPVSLKSLENDEYKRNVKGYLPDSQTAFLDEIWKASPAIHNTLLTIINEKKFHNGNNVLNVPLKVLIAASNELPAKNMGLEALWDRFLIRLVVNPVSENGFFDMALQPEGIVENFYDFDNQEVENLKISNDELLNFRAEIVKIPLEENVKNIIVDIRKELEIRNLAENLNNSENFYVSDRRWKKIIHIMRTAAFINGRKSVQLPDCQLIKYCIWNSAEQISIAEEIVENCIRQNGLIVDSKIDDIKTELENFHQKVLSTFYILQPQRPLIIEIEGGNAYKFSRDFTHKNLKVTFWNNKTGDIYDKNKQKIGNISSDFFRVDGTDVVFSAESFSQVAAELEPDNNLYYKFNNQLVTNGNYNAIVVNFENKYQIIKRIINSELLNIDNIYQSNSLMFENEIFMNDNFENLFTSDVQKNKILLEDFLVNLEKSRALYISKTEEIAIKGND